MAHQEDYSTTRLSLFYNEDFGYWKGWIEYHLKTQVEMWIVIQTGFTILTEYRVPIEEEDWGWLEAQIKKESFYRFKRLDLTYQLTNE